MAGRFGSVITAMVTPFKDDGSLDLDRAQELVAWLLDHGSDGLVIAGSTGEAATLSDEEKTSLWRAAVEAARGKGPIIAGSGTYDTRHSIHLTEEAEKAGCDGLLVVSPYYNKPPQSGLYEHFSAVAKATSLPVLVYNIPGRTAVRISNDTLLRLAGVENIVGVKDSTADFDGLSHLIAAVPEGFEVYTGDDWATFGSVCLGAVGVISVAAHVVGQRMKQMIDLIEGGDVAAARKSHHELLPVYDVLFLTTNPIPVKAAIALIGHPAGPPRLPLVPATDDETAKIRRALGDAGVL
ncbi:MAG TPA: 4-hydroxy-tetrahydrodipicolinate synthase [Actinomycetota bacterium]|jgi:4-hydroxy-tetrahydrodipicolinate synthase|nr:4-hydroxy-tetrahydrodipicolinate synthase [Actinomycetota bacterium]